MYRYMYAFVCDSIDCWHLKIYFCAVKSSSGSVWQWLPSERKANEVEFLRQPCDYGEYFSTVHSWLCMYAYMTLADKIALFLIEKTRTVFEYTVYRNSSSKRPCSCKRPGLSFDVQSLNAPSPHPPFHVQAMGNVYAYREVKIHLLRLNCAERQEPQC